jgi:hypothetical protein
MNIQYWRVAKSGVVANGSDDRRNPVGEKADEAQDDIVSQQDMKLAAAKMENYFEGLKPGPVATAAGKVN